MLNISFSHSNTNLPIGQLSQEQFLLSKYLSILHALLNSQSGVLGFHIKLFLQEPHSHQLSS